MTKTSSNTKNALRNRTRLEWVLVIALLLIAFLWAASRYEWWPLNGPKDNLGTAFYTSRKVVAETPGAASSISGGSGGSTGTATRSTSSNNSTTSNTTTNTGGGGSGTPDPGGGGGSGSSSGSLLSLAAGINTGDSKQEISAQLGGLGQSCAVTVNLPLGLGKQEVCTITQGNRTVTVTYLNDRVLSASLGGL